MNRRSVKLLQNHFPGSLALTNPEDTNRRSSTTTPFSRPVANTACSFVLVLLLSGSLLG